MKLLRNAVVIGLAALYDTVDGSALPFALDADGCVVDYQPGCAAHDVPMMYKDLCVCTTPPAHPARPRSRARAVSTTIRLCAVR